VLLKDPAGRVEEWPVERVMEQIHPILRGWVVLSLSKMLSGANAFAISNIQKDETEAP
jgi:hypothetical protein